MFSNRPWLAALGAFAFSGALLAACSSGTAVTPAAGSGGAGGGAAADGPAGGGGGQTIGSGGAGAGADTTTADDAHPPGTGGAGGGSGGSIGSIDGGADTRMPLQGTVKILVLGSSNETDTCWRAFLWQKLRADGVMNFDFVGRNSTGPDCGVPGYDKDVEAQPGTIITGFTANDFAVRFKANPPQIVLVHVGGADARNGVPIPKILGAYTLAVEQARLVNPQVIFFVAQHTPQVPPTGISELNAAIPGWAAQISTPQSPVGAVDLFTGIVPAMDQSDGTHLNVAGSQKVAGWWLNVLLPLFKP